MLNLQQISKTDTVLLPTIFQALQDNRVFLKPEYRESFIKNINNLLSLRESRQNALSLLNIFCDHHAITHSPLITEKTCLEINLIEQLLKIIEQEPRYTAECFEILKKLLKITAKNPDTNKIVQSKYVQKIIDSIVTSRTSPEHSLKCLAMCFEIHGGTSGVFKNKIYDYCVSFIDVPESGIAVHAANCLHLLQQSRGGSVGGGVYKKCWAEFHDRNLGSLEDILEQITKKNSGKIIGKSEQLQLPELKLSPQPYNMYTQLLVRFQNVATILQVSLRRSFTTAKSIQANRIMTIIEDGIAVSQALLAKKAITESMVLSLLHGRIHLNLLSILQALILSLKQNIIIHSKTICDVLWRCLKQTNGNEQMKFEANLKLRVATYETLISFMKTSPNNFYFKSVMENVMKEALADVTPANDEVCLMMPQENGGKSNKKKKLTAAKRISDNTNFQNMSDEQKVCAKALECLTVMLACQGVLMKPVLFMILQEKINSVAFNTLSKVQRDGDLYRDPECRSKLSNVVTSMMIHPVNKAPVPVNYGLAILTKSKQNDPDASVRDNSAMNLYQAETAIHNRKDVFYFPADYKELKDTLMFNKQTVQKFNETRLPVAQNGNSSNIVEIDDESSKESEDVAMIDDEELDPPPGDDVNVISDDSEPEVTENTETHQISDDDDVEDTTEDIEVVGDEEPEVDEETPEIDNEEPEVAKNTPEVDSNTPENDKNTQEIEPEAEDIPEHVQKPSPRKSSRNQKRPSPPETSKTTPKKKKISEKNDDALVEEMLADFNE